MDVISRAIGLRSFRIVVAVFPLAFAMALIGPGPSGSGGPVASLAAGEAHACKGAGANPGKVRPARASRAVMCLVNRRRANNNLPRVSMRKPLRAAAKRHSRRMVRTGCFSHECGGTLVNRVHQTAYLPCNCTYSLGETIAWGAGARGKPRRIVRAWMNSPGHRGVLMHRAFRHIGVGVVWGAPGQPNRSGAGTFTAILGFKR